MPSLFSRLQEDLNRGLSCVKPLWRYKAKYWVTSVYAADIDQDGDIEVLAGSRDGRTYALTRGGELIWEQEMGPKNAKSWVSSVVALSLPLDQQVARVVAGSRDGKVYVLDKDGEMLGKDVVLPASQRVSSSLVPSEYHWYDAHHAIMQLHADAASPQDIVFCSADRCAYGFDLARAELRWRLPLVGHIGVIFACDVNEDGCSETLIGSDDRTLLLLSSTGQQICRRQMDQAIYSLFACDVDQDGVIEILVGTRAKKLYALWPDLSEKWSLTLSSRPLALSVADVNNDQRFEILAACDDQFFYILDDTGKPIWRQNFGARFYSLYALDLDRDGHIEVLAGADDNHIYDLRIQLSKDLDKKIRRDYATLGKPEPETLLDLTGEQRDLLLDILSTNNRMFDKNLSLEGAEMALADGNISGALLVLLKLAQQKFQFLWEKEAIGYLNTLCLGDLTGDSRRVIVVGAPDGGLSAFGPAGRLLWSKASSNEQILDAQAGYLHGGRSEDLAFLSSSGRLSLMRGDKKREISDFSFPEPASCFSLLAANPQGPSEILIGTESGRVYLYTNDFENPAQVFTLPDSVQIVYASVPYKGLYRSPEILISTSANQVLAYTRGGKHPWTFDAQGRILALCAQDLDNDGQLEVLIGSEDCNVHVLDHQGNRLWRYVFSHSVQALETADLDDDGKLEILVGGADGILSVFKYTGDLIWRYHARDRIQALRVADIDQDGNKEVVVISEGCMEVLRVIGQARITSLIEGCWSYLLSDRAPLAALLPFIKGIGPYLRGAALRKLAALRPLPPETFDLLEEAADDSFVAVRKDLAEAVMLAYPADPQRAGRLLSKLFTDKIRDVRMEVIEHLELLARYDWGAVLSYLKRASEAPDRNARRAAIRKVSHLISELNSPPDESTYKLTEALLTLLLEVVQDSEWKWISEEVGRVLADLLNLYPSNFLDYFYRFITYKLQSSKLALRYSLMLRHTAYNLSSPEAQQAFACLIDLCFDFNETNALERLSRATSALEAVRSARRGTDLWLICCELRDLFALSELEGLVTYEFRLKLEQFRIVNAAVEAFLRVGERLSMVTRPLKTYLRREDPSDRLRYLLDGMNELEALQRFVDREYGASPVPGSLQPLVPEFVVFKVLFARWMEMLMIHLNDLRSPAELVCSLQSRQVHFEEEQAVGIWLLVTNNGRSAATNVRVTLLPSERFEVLRPSFEVDVVAPYQEVVAEFLIQPLGKPAPVTLTFEVFYDELEQGSPALVFQDRLDFIEWHREFAPIDNPYTTGTPIQDSHMCYGREGDLAYLQDNLARTTAQTVLVLYGQRRSGKTTLLYQLVNTPLLAQHVPVLIDLQSLAYNLDIGNFLFKVAYAISQALQKRSLLLPPPQRAEFIGLDADPLFSFDCFLDAVEPLLQGRKLILLLDEFEVLEDQVNEGVLKPAIFQYLRSMMQRRQYMHFLLSGTHHIEKLTHDYWSVFFNIALHYLLPSRITDSGSEALITEPVLGSLEYEPLAVTKIRQLTADQPYLIHLVCRSLVDHCNKQHKNYATINDVNRVLRDVMDTGTIHFDWLWKQIGEQEKQGDKQEKQFDEHVRFLLLVIAGGLRDEGRQFSLDDISAIYRKHGIPYRRSRVSSSLKKLLEEAVIEADEGSQSETTRYRVAIGLLRQWLRRGDLMDQTRDALKQQVMAQQVEAARTQSMLPGSQSLAHASD